MKGLLGKIDIFNEEDAMDWRLRKRKREKNPIAG
jgi:hypothetical protein